MHNHMRRLNIWIVSTMVMAGVTVSPAAFAQEESDPDVPRSPVPPPTTASSAIDAADARYAQVLAAVVDRDGLVRYDWLAMARHKDWLAECIDGYAKVTLPSDGPQRLALWCNAFNANVLQLALEESLKEDFVNVQRVGGFFESKPIIVAGETLTLNGLQNDRIRKEGDPRVHAALVCAAKGSPPLRPEPYTAERFDAQLDEQCRTWINDKRRNFVRGDVLVLSRTLDWYGSDFIGKPYGDHLGFVKAYAAPDGPVARYLERTERPQVEWEPFDWSLNQAPFRPAPRREPEQ